MSYTIHNVVVLAMTETEQLKELNQAQKQAYISSNYGIKYPQGVSVRPVTYCMWQLSTPHMNNKYYLILFSNGITIIH